MNTKKQTVTPSCPRPRVLISLDFGEKNEIGVIYMSVAFHGRLTFENRPKISGLRSKVKNLQNLSFVFCLVITCNKTKTLVFQDFYT